MERTEHETRGASTNPVWKAAATVGHFLLGYDVVTGKAEVGHHTSWEAQAWWQPCARFPRRRHCYDFGDVIIEISKKQRSKELGHEKVKKYC
jgi:hypothetical protein